MQYNYIKMGQENHEKEKQIGVTSNGGKCGARRSYSQDPNFCFEWLD